MRRALVCVAVCFVMFYPAAAFSQQSEASNPWTGNVNLLLGTRFLEKDNWEPLDKQLEGGLLVDFRPKRWWISFAVDFLYSWDEDEIDVVDLGIGTYSVKIKSRIWELDLGIRKIWESPEYIRPYIGGGFAIINGQMKSEAFGDSVSDDETGYGIWANAGLYVTIYKHFNIGIDGRWSKAEVDLFDRQARVGGWQVGAIAGFHW